MSAVLDDRSPIVAIATAPGRGGIGVVRVSGSDLKPMAQALLGVVPSPRQARFGPFLAADGSAIDHGLALYFPAPHSYTGEDVLELQGHGGPVVLQMLVRRALEAGVDIGLRLARAGEFTQRAFLNDKLDLAQAEAVADLIDAGTEQAARSALRSLDGEFSRRIDALVTELIELRTLVEATLDFPEEEIDFLEASDAGGRLERVDAALSQVLQQARQGRLLRDGMTVVLTGAPNVGKSSLLNALAGAEVAIVTNVPGTTRDRISQAIQIEGVPLSIVDTAGLRETEDEVERIGIARTWEAVAQADVVVRMVDAAVEAGVGTQAYAGTQANASSAGHAGQAAGVGVGVTADPSVSAPMDAARGDAVDMDTRLPDGVPVLRVVNKIDLLGAPARLEQEESGVPGAAGTVWLSARSGEGIDLLRAQLLTLSGWQGAGESVFIARERHLHALRRAQTHVDAAREHARAGNQRLELFAEELRLAQECLSEITGEFSADDLLGEIFSRFCIGK